MRVTHIRIQDFRCIGQVDCELSPLTVLIGANGAGKSSLLEAVQFFSNLHGGISFSNMFSPQGGFQANRRYQAAPDGTIRLGVSTGDDELALHYDVHLRGEGPTGCFVESETLGWQQKRPGTPPADSALFERSDTALYRKGVGVGQTAHGPSTVVHKCAGEPGTPKLLAALHHVSLWPVHRFDPKGSVRSPQQLSPSVLPTAEGKELYSTLYTMRLDRPELYDELLEVLRLAVPEFDRLEFPPAGGGLINLTWHQKNLSSPLYPVQLSDGTLRLLWLMTVLHSVPDDGLVLLDEPELSLHPQWLLLLVSVLRSMAARTRILVATQSVELVRWCEPAELVVADLTDTGSNILRPRDRGDLDEWLKDFNLGELWTMGELGGRR